MAKNIDLTIIQKKSKEVKLSESFLKLVLSNIKSKLHAFIPVVNSMRLLPVEEEVFLCTDGVSIYYHPESIIECARHRDFGCLEKMIMHIIFHGLLGHFEDTEWKDKKLAWAVHDIEVDRYMRKVYLEEELGIFGREIVDDYICDELYYKGSKNVEFRRMIYIQGKDCMFDNHIFWDPKYRRAELRNGNATENNDEAKRTSNKGDKQTTGGFWSEMRKRIDLDEKHLAEKFSMRMDLWTKKQTQMHGNLPSDEENIVNLVSGTTNTYKELMEKITKCSELTKEEDTIDKILYTYGLEMYGDVPLVEPDELTETKKLHTIVVAVDTSGSCTWRAERFFREILSVFNAIKQVAEVEHICYVECDTEIHYEENHKDIESFLRWGKSHGFKGGGGTDFCPVFEKVNELYDAGEQIDALLYITDGEGEFPKLEEIREYPVYILLDYDDEYDDYDEEAYLQWLPDWVEVIRLEKEEEK